MIEIFCKEGDEDTKTIVDTLNENSIFFEEKNIDLDEVKSELKEKNVYLDPPIIKFYDYYYTKIDIFHGSEINRNLIDKFKSDITDYIEIITYRKGYGKFYLNIGNGFKIDFTQSKELLKKIHLIKEFANNEKRYNKDIQMEDPSEIEDQADGENLDEDLEIENNSDYGGPTLILYDESGSRQRFSGIYKSKLLLKNLKKIDLFIELVPEYKEYTGSQSMEEWFFQREISVNDYNGNPVLIINGQYTQGREKWKRLRDLLYARPENLPIVKKFIRFQ